MKKLMCTGAAIFVLLSATFALAADVTGAWTGQAPGPNGESFQLTFTFKQDGAKLTGTVAVPQGPPLDISNGKMDGDKISFDVSFNGTTIKHDGVVNGDEIKLNSKSDDPNFPASTLTLTRAK
jgi:hypothetical protein